jgi:hypothetical protein
MIVFSFSISIKKYMNKVTLHKFGYFDHNHKSVHRYGTNEGINKILGLVIARFDLDSDFRLDNSEVDWDDNNEGITKIGFDPKKCSSAEEIRKVIGLYPIEVQIS